MFGGDMFELRILRIVSPGGFFADKLQYRSLLTTSSTDIVDGKIVKQTILPEWFDVPIVVVYE